MFSESADIYDLVYSFKDYQKESDEIKQIIKFQHPNCKTILDIGCGTAEHHKYLKEDFSIDGIDISDTFVSLARQKNPKGVYRTADMSAFDLKKKYDVILCLFSSIGYLKTVEQIVSALNCFHQHLNQGGLILVEPWFEKDATPGRIGMTTYDKDEVKICRMTYGTTEGDFSILNFEYLVTTVSNGIQHFKERHELRLTSREEMAAAFKEANLNVTHDAEGLIGRGMYCATKQE